MNSRVEEREPRGFESLKLLQFFVLLSVEVTVDFYLEARMRYTGGSTGDR